MGLTEPRLQASGKDSPDRIELNDVARCATRLLIVNPLESTQLRSNSKAPL